MGILSDPAPGRPRRLGESSRARALGDVGAALGGGGAGVLVSYSCGSCYASVTIPSRVYRQLGCLDRAGEGPPVPDLAGRVFGELLDAERVGVVGRPALGDRPSPAVPRRRARQPPPDAGMFETAPGPAMEITGSSLMIVPMPSPSAIIP